MTTKSEEYLKKMEEDFFEGAKKLALMLAEQAEAAGIDMYQLACACDMISQGVKENVEKEITERFGSMEEAEKVAMSNLEEHIKMEEEMKEKKGQKIVDIAIARASKSVH